jgi:KaiC/GvpD/RAD55 family RecA-like ATPase
MYRRERPLSSEASLSGKSFLESIYYASLWLARSVDLPKLLALPVLGELVQDGFAYGRNYVVEFDSDSLWYETSLFMVADALGRGIKAEYHTFMHMPSQVRQSLSGFGLDLEDLEEKRLFRIVDTYTGLTGLPMKGESRLTASGLSSEIHKSDWLSGLTAQIVKLMEQGVPEEAKGWLHVDDNTSIFNRYLSEREILDMFQTKIFPFFRLAEITTIHAQLTSAVSDSFLKQFEAQCDGVIDFTSREERGEIERYVRPRSFREKACDSRWRHLVLRDNGETTLDRKHLKDDQLGIRGWIRGPKKR